MLVAEELEAGGQVPGPRRVVPPQGRGGRVLEGRPVVVARLDVLVLGEVGAPRPRAEGLDHVGRGAAVRDEEGRAVVAHQRVVGQLQGDGPAPLESAPRRGLHAAARVHGPALVGHPAQGLVVEVHAGAKRGGQCDRRSNGKKKKRARWREKTHAVGN